MIAIQNIAYALMFQYNQVYNLKLIVIKVSYNTTITKTDVIYVSSVSKTLENAIRLYAVSRYFYII